MKVLATSPRRAAGRRRAAVAGAVARRRGGVGSAAVELFVERARAVDPRLHARRRRRRGRGGGDLPAAGRHRAGDRAGGGPDGVDERRRTCGTASTTASACWRVRRGLERHQTLRHAVAWSYDLLDDAERAVLDRCSVFAGGFDLAAPRRSGDPTASTTTPSWTCWTRSSASRCRRRPGVGPHPLRHVGDDPPVRRGATRRHRRRATEVRTAHAHHFAGRLPDVIAVVGRPSSAGGIHLVQRRAGQSAHRLSVGRRSQRPRYQLQPSPVTRRFSATRVGPTRR